MYIWSGLIKNYYLNKWYNYIKTTGFSWSFQKQLWVVTPCYPIYPFHFHGNGFCFHNRQTYKTSDWLYSHSSTTMGLFDKLASMLRVRKEQVNILVIGLNNSGKSTIVNHFKEPEEKSAAIVPTVGFNVERFQSEWIWWLYLNTVSLEIFCRPRNSVYGLWHVRCWAVPKLMGAPL